MNNYLKYLSLNAPKRRRMEKSFLRIIFHKLHSFELRGFFILNKKNPDFNKQKSGKQGEYFDAGILSPFYPAQMETNSENITKNGKKVTRALRYFLHNLDSQISDGCTIPALIHAHQREPEDKNFCRPFFGQAFKATV